MRSDIGIISDLSDIITNKIQTKHDVHDKFYRRQKIKTVALQNRK